MKAFCFVGSNSIESYGICLSKKIEERLKKLNFVTSFYTAKDTKIDFCRGCTQCFTKGRCVLDERDDLKKIKSDMLEADLIIWISPVYGLNVSGTMKNYIDRLCYWLHTLELTGKIGVVVSVTDNTGWKFVNQYLEKMMCYMGCNVVDKYSFIKIKKEETLSKLSDEIIRNINEAIRANKQYLSNEELEDYFVHLKSVYSNLDGECLKDCEVYEVNYWYENKMIDCDTFQDWINKKQI